MSIILLDLRSKRKDRVFWPMVKRWNENFKVGMGKFKGFWFGEASIN